MKLQEIKGTKSLKFTDADELVQKLIDQGFFKKKLGRGMYGIAFELQNGDVLKCWASDPAYEKFIEYCAAHKSNPYLIKPKGKMRRIPLSYVDQEYDSEEAAFFRFIRLEKLEPVSSLKDFGYPDGSQDRAERFLNSFQNTAIYQGYDEEVPPLDGKDEMFKYLGLDPAKVTTEFRKNILEIAKLVIHFRHETDFGELDLQLGNFGMRGSQVVIMDPVKDEFGDGELIPIAKVLKDDT